MAPYSSAEIDRFEYWQATMKRPRSSLQSARTTLASKLRPELVSVNMSFGFGTPGTVSILLKRTMLWSIGYPLSSRARTFMFGTLRLISTSTLLVYS